jgi:hypothetical protein
MKGDREIDKENWYVTNMKTDMWCGGLRDITTPALAPPHFTIAKSIYNKSQKRASL